MSSPTDDQLALIMGLRGTTKQQEEARQYIAEQVKLADYAKSEAKSQLDAPNLKPYGWGVVDKDGEPRLAHDFFTRESAAQGFVQWATEIRSASAPFRVVQLFYKEED